MLLIHKSGEQIVHTIEYHSNSQNLIHGPSKIATFTQKVLCNARSLNNCACNCTCKQSIPCQYHTLKFLKILRNYTHKIRVKLGGLNHQAAYLSLIVSVMFDTHHFKPVRNLHSISL